jgi:hypothetical protein
VSRRNRGRGPTDAWLARFLTRFDWMHRVLLDIPHEGPATNVEWWTEPDRDASREYDDPESAPSPPYQA